MYRRSYVDVQPYLHPAPKLARALKTTAEEFEAMIQKGVPH